MSKVTSKISGREITQAQYITELVCSRLYKKEEGVEAPVAFWRKSGEWTNKYKTQIVRANALLRMYDFDVIIKILNQETWMWSLFNGKLEKLLVREQKIYDKTTKKLKEKEIVIEKQETFRKKQFGKKKTNLNKLRDME